MADALTRYILKKMKNQVRNGGGILAPPNLQRVKNGIAAISVPWNG
jgi:hypothetical protein